MTSKSYESADNRILSDAELDAVNGGSVNDTIAGAGKALVSVLEKVVDTIVPGPSWCDGAYGRPKC
jgi:hypothetical protein